MRTDDAVITLGAVIKGSTPHFDYVCAEVSKGVATVSLQSNVPEIFWRTYYKYYKEAIQRAGTKAGNKGFDAGVTAIEMVNLLKGDVIMDKDHGEGIGTCCSGRGKCKS